MPAPLWPTFCGVSNGLWVGTAAAYSPYSGGRLPLALHDGALLREESPSALTQPPARPPTGLACWAGRAFG